MCSTSSRLAITWMAQGVKRIRYLTATKTTLHGPLYCAHGVGVCEERHAHTRRLGGGRAERLLARPHPPHLLIERRTTVQTKRSRDYCAPPTHPQTLLPLLEIQRVLFSHGLICGRVQESAPGDRMLGSRVYSSAFRTTLFSQPLNSAAFSGRASTCGGLVPTAVRAILSCPTTVTPEWSSKLWEVTRKTAVYMRGIVSGTKSQQCPNLRKLLCSPRPGKLDIRESLGAVACRTQSSLLLIRR